MNSAKYFLFSLFFLLGASFQAADSIASDEEFFEINDSEQQSVDYEPCFELDPNQKPLEVMCPTLRLRQLMEKPSVKRVKRANEFAAVLAFDDYETVENMLESTPWLIYQEDDRGYLPIFTAIDHCLGDLVESFFEDIGQKNPLCQGKTLIEFTYACMERDKECAEKVTKYRDLIDFFIEKQPRVPFCKRPLSKSKGIRRLPIKNGAACKVRRKVKSSRKLFRIKPLILSLLKEFR